jgi:hypothetical protein
LTAARLVGAALLVLAGGVGAAAAERQDLRDIRVGMPIAELPAPGYMGFACVKPEKSLDGWADWRTCDADTAGLRAMHFEFDNSSNPIARFNDKLEGTKVAGHPAVLTLFVTDDGRVGGLKIETDPHAPLYMRKKAFLLFAQVKDRYGESGWTCTSAPPTADQEPLGGLFLNDHCEKTAEGRHLVLERQLYRRAGKDIKEFVGSTTFTVMLAS